MSAECDKCGTDLVYGEDWPVGYCEPCKLRDELQAERAAREAVERERDNWHEGWRSQAVTIQYLENGLDAERRQREELEREVKALKEKYEGLS